VTAAYQPDFDHDRVYGEQGEALVERLRSLALAGSIETKRKRYPDSQFYIELAHRPRGRSEYVKSGLNVTRSDYLAYVVGDSGVVVFFPTRLIRQYLRQNNGVPASERDGGNPTKGRLISLDAFLTWCSALDEGQVTRAGSHGSAAACLSSSASLTRSPLSPSGRGALAQPRNTTGPDRTDMGVMRGRGQKEPS